MFVKFSVYEYQETDKCFGVIFQSIGKKTQWFRTVWFSKASINYFIEGEQLTIEASEELFVRRFHTTLWREHWVLTHEVNSKQY